MSNLPVYFFSLYLAPCEIIKTLDRIRINFFWGSGLEDTKIAWISWKDVMASLAKGGLCDNWQFRETIYKPALL